MPPRTPRRARSWRTPREPWRARPERRAAGPGDTAGAATQRTHRLPAPAAGADLARDLLRGPDGLPRVDLALRPGRLAGDRLRHDRARAELLHGARRLLAPVPPVPAVRRHGDRAVHRARLPARLRDRLQVRPVEERD